MPSKGEETPVPLSQLLEGGGLDREKLRECLANVHPVDLAELLDDVDLENRIRVFEILDPPVAAQVLAAMPKEYRVELVDSMGEERLAAVIDRLPDYVVADLIDHLPVHKEKAVLARLEGEKADDVRELRQFLPHTAGGRMTRNFVAVPDSFTSGETLKAIQGAVGPDTVEFVYVVGEDERLRGVLSLPKLMVHRSEEPVRNFMRRDVTFVGPTADQEEVARIAQKYRLRHVPVVDNEMKLLGVVTLQDIIEVIRHEAEEDMLKMAGAGHVNLLRAPLLRRIQARVPWLAACLALELLVSFVMRGYGRTLDRRVLAYFIPAIMAMGGNVGLQSATAVVRGMATGDIVLAQAMRVILAEVRIGVSIGFLAASTIAFAAFILSLGAPEAVSLALVVFISMSVSLTTAAAFGAYLPFFMRRLGKDPAIASGPFVTGFNDLLNVTLYLNVATLILGSVSGT